MKRSLIQIIAGGALFAAALLVGSEHAWVQLALFIAAYLVVGGDVVWSALRNILRGQVFDENFLMSLATVGAFAVGEYPEAVGVMLFFQVGELFQNYAVGQSRKSIAALMDIRPDYANVRRGGELVRVEPDEVKTGDVIVVRPGERVPLDGVVLEGESALDTAALTGESVPREVAAGAEVLSGCINLSGMLTVEVKCEYGESTVSKILDLVENASSKKSNSERFITKFAAVYTPIVVGAAVLLAALPPLILRDGSFSVWLYRALTFLVVSCPCALVISIPLSFFGGIGGASKSGILVKGSNYLEALARTETVVFDKTGTLTRGVFEVQQVRPVGMEPQALLRLAAYAESYSSHPISQSLRAAYGAEIRADEVADVEELAGYGVRAAVDGKTVLAGNARLMEREGIAYEQNAEPGTIVHLAADGVYAGYIVIADAVKSDAALAVRRLHEAKIGQIVMLTGDTKETGERVARELGIDRVYAGLLPADKVERVEQLLQQASPKGKLAFVGDGINDAPVLARADIGIAMGGLGSDAAIEAADVVIMTDEPSKLATAMKISQKTLRIVRQNIVLALGVKLAVLVLSAVGRANMWAAVFADVGVAVIAILNALRALSTKEIDA